MKQTKQDRRSQRTYSLVNAAMMELLAEKRYEAITVQELLDRAGIGRSTFYSHYYDKEDVLESIARQQVEVLNQQFALRSGDRGQEILPGLELFQHVQERYQYFQAMLRGHAGEMVWEAAYSALQRTIEQTLAASYAEKHAPPIPPAVVSHYLAGALLNLLKWWLQADMPYTPEQMNQFFQQMALQGIRTVIEEGK